MHTIQKYTLIVGFILLINIVSIFAVGIPSARFNSVNENIDPESSFGGYTLYGTDISRFVYLIDENGEIVHTWKSKNGYTSSVYLLENGTLVRGCGLDYKISSIFHCEKGIMGRVEMLDWDGNLIWEFEHATLRQVINHDIEVLPNGNILISVFGGPYTFKAIALGVNPEPITYMGFYNAYLIEVEPTFPKGGNIVWRWDPWDHIIQDFDPSKPNYGVVEDHPELLDINYEQPGTKQGGVDMLHINSIDYNDELDQVLLGMRSLDEIWIIDHSTTTEEAAGHSGGRYGKGGDILYRWGNPEVYRRGNLSDKKLYKQHDARWIEKGCPGEGNITIFNNGENRPGDKYSEVLEIVPPIDENGNYTLELNSTYGPDQPFWSYTAEEKTDFYSMRFSSVQRLPNGNTLICNGYEGEFFELTPEEEVVWTYTNYFPHKLHNNVFHIQRYPSDYPGLGEFNHVQDNRFLLRYLEKNPTISPILRIILQNLLY